MTKLPILIFLFLALVFALTIGAFLLKFVCWIYNLLVDGYQAAELEVDEDIRDESYNVTGPSDPNPFASPKQYQHRAELSPEVGVRSPSYLRSVLINGILTGVFIVVSVMTAVALPMTSGAPQGLNLATLSWSGILVLLGAYVVEYFLLCVLLMAFLPTKFIKAMIVAKLYFVVLVGILVAIGLGLHFLASANGVELTGVSFGTLW